MFGFPMKRGRHMFAAGAFAMLLGALAPGLASAEATLRVMGEPGDVMTGGTTLWFTDATSTFGYANMANTFMCTVGGSLVQLQFRGCVSYPIAKGIYSPVANSALDNDPRLDERYAGNTCRPAAGGFQVRRFAIAPNGSVREAWITWDTQCAVGGPRQHGELRVNADTTLWQDVPADTWWFGGDSAIVRVQAHEVNGRMVALAATGLPAGATFTDLGGGAGRFAWLTPRVVGEQTQSLTIVAESDLGVRDTIGTRVHVEPRGLVRLTSDPGDVVGGGESFTNASPSNPPKLSEGQPAYGVDFVTTYLTTQYRFTFIAPFGRALAEGVYDEVDRARIQPTMLAGLDVTAHVGCNRVVGRFVIRKLSRDGQGKLTSLWATVENRCEGATPALRAEIQFNTDTLLYTLAPSDVNVEPGDSVRFSVTAISSRGLPVTLGVSGLPSGSACEFGDAGATFRWRAPSLATSEWPVVFTAVDAEGVTDTVVTHIHVLSVRRLVEQTMGATCALQSTQLALTGAHVDFRATSSLAYEQSSISTNGQRSGGVDLRGPFGIPLRKGTHTVAGFEYTGSDRIYGALTYYSNSSGTALTLGTLHVRKLQMDASGRVSSIWAVWRGQCDGWATPAGQVVLDADTSIYITAPAIPMVERDRSVQFAVTGTSLTGGPVNLACTSKPAGSSFTPGAGNSGTFTWPAATPAGLVPATFVATDALGHADTLTSLIRVVPPQLLELDADAGYSPWPAHLRLDATNSNFVVFTAGAPDLYCYALGQTWEVKLQAPYSRRVAPGVYENAAANAYLPTQRAPLLFLNLGGTNVTGDSMAYHVRKIGFSAAGKLSQLWLTYFYTRSGKRITGEVRFGEPDTSLYLSAPADLYANSASSVQFTARATQVGGRPVALSASGVPAGASFRDNGDGTASFAWSGSTQPGTFGPITVAASDDQGHRDTCVTYVHVVEPATVSATRQLTHYGQTWASDLTAAAVNADIALVPSALHGARVNVTTRTEVWSFEFVAPLDAPLGPGVYANGSGSAVRGGAIPFMSISHGYQTCNTGGNGSFTVLDASYDAAGKIKSLWLTFQDSCSQELVLSGEVRYGQGNQAVATLVDRVMARGDDGVASLGWIVSGTVFGALRLERQVPGEAGWSELASLTRDASGRVAYDDADVQPGATYRYRLVSDEGRGAVLDEVALTIGAGVRFGIGRVGPNPVLGALSVQFVGRYAGSLRAQLVDVAGRTVWRDTREGVPAGARELQFDVPHSLRAGMYVLRLSWDGGRAERRVILVR